MGCRARGVRSKGSPSAIGARLIACLGSLFICCVGLVACEQPKFEYLSGHGVTLRRVTKLEVDADPQRVAALAGDLRFSGRHISALIGGLRRPGSLKGVVLEAHFAGVESAHSIAALRPRIFLGSRSFALTPTSLHILDLRGEPTVRSRLALDLGDERLLVRQDWRVGDDRRSLHVHTWPQLSKRE